MKNLKFYQDVTIECDDDGNDIEKLVWFCTDGITTYWGDTKSEAASRFGVAIGFDD